MICDSRIYVDGGNRLTKVMQESKKPFSFPTVISSAETDLDYGLNFDSWDFEDMPTKLDIDSVLVEIIKDGESLGKKLVGKAAENKGLLIRDRNRYVKKAGDEVITFSTITGIAFNLNKHLKDNQTIDLTVNQPLIEYALDRKSSIQKYETNLKGSFKVIFYNIFNTSEAVSTVNFTIAKIVFCPEAIAAFYSYAINEYGKTKNEFLEKKTIVWDIGSGQINVAAFDGMNLLGINTFEKGMLDCYDKISLILYNNYRNKLDRKPTSFEIDNIIRYENMILTAKKGETINIEKIVSEVFDNFSYELNKDIREFAKSKSISNSNDIIFCGGGSNLIYQDLLKYLNSDFSCIQSGMGEFNNVVGSMYYRMYKDTLIHKEE